MCVRMSDTDITASFLNQRRDLVVPIKVSLFDITMTEHRIQIAAILFCLAEHGFSSNAEPISMEDAMEQAGIIHNKVAEDKLMRAIEVFRQELKEEGIDAAVRYTIQLMQATTMNDESASKPIDNENSADDKVKGEEAEQVEPASKPPKNDDIHSTLESSAEVKVNSKQNSEVAKQVDHAAADSASEPNNENSTTTEKDDEDLEVVAFKEATRRYAVEKAKPKGKGAHWISVEIEQEFGIWIGEGRIRRAVAKGRAGMSPLRRVFIQK